MIEGQPFGEVLRANKTELAEEETEIATRISIINYLMAERKMKYQLWANKRADHCFQRGAVHRCHFLGNGFGGGNSAPGDLLRKGFPIDAECGRIEKQGNLEPSNKQIP